MLIALLADVHANLEALTACLRHAEGNGAGRFAFLGDLVGYGADPQAVVDIVARYAADGAIVVKGNHDEAVRKTASYMNDSLRSVIEWTREALSAEAKDFLASRPLYVSERPMYFVHASAAAPQRWDYVDSPAAAERSIAASGTAYTFSGHVHDQELHFRGAQGKMTVFHPIPGRSVPVGAHRSWLALVGSVGQPRDGNPAAAYALFDTARERIAFHRVPYDHLAATRKIREAGLPLSVAHRVEHGI